jgi:hypothetical protein
VRALVRVLVNPEWDITEYLDGDIKGEQLFSFYAMIRETEKVGKKVPTFEHWWEIFKYINPDIKMESDWQDDTRIQEKLWLKLAWYRGRDTWFLRDYGEEWNYWSSSSPLKNHQYGLFVSLISKQIYPLDYTSKEYGFSVRCLK